MRFFTAAYGEKYRLFCVGLVRSFADHLPGETLHVATDDVPGLEKILWNNGVNPSSVGVYELSRSDLDAWPIQAAPFRARNLRVIQKFCSRLPGNENVCWIDADALILADPRPYMERGKINVIGHGIPPGGNELQEKRLGNQVVIPLRDYVIGCFWSMPAHLAIRMADLAIARNQWSDKGVRSTVHQSVLNLVCKQNPGIVRRLDRLDEGLFWGLEAGHLHPQNKSIREFRMVDGEIWYRDRKVMQLHMPSTALGRNMQRRFVDWPDDVGACLSTYWRSSTGFPRAGAMPSPGLKT